MLKLTARPSPGNINTPFGPRPKPTPSSPAIHYGQDYGWGNGRDIYAAADGVVVEGDGAALSGAYGNRTRIDHGDGFETWYCHQSVRLVRKGQRVTAGQKIGVQGATGNVVGVHLHFEVRRNGVAVDPAPYFAAASAKPAIPTSGSKPVSAPTSSATPIQEDDMAGHDGDFQNIKDGIGDLQKVQALGVDKLTDEVLADDHLRLQRLELRNTNIENKVDLILDRLGVPREQFPPVAS